MDACNDTTEIFQGLVSIERKSELPARMTEELSKPYGKHKIRIIQKLNRKRKSSVQRGLKHRARKYLTR